MYRGETNGNHPRELQTPRGPGREGGPRRRDLTQDRTEVVTEALREYLRDVEDDEWFREAVVELYLDDEIGFETLEGVGGRQDAESIRASKGLLDRGDDLAEELADL